MEMDMVDPPDAYVPLPIAEPGDGKPPAPPDAGAGAYFTDDSELFLGDPAHTGFDGGAVVAGHSVQVEVEAAAEPAPQEPPAPVKRKRGRPPKNPGGSGRAPAAKKRREDEEEVVCFICFDGGNLVVCDRRGCPKVYHPACVGRDDAFFRTKARWNCGWHICSKCRKSACYMCYTCTNSVCKGCIRETNILCVRGNMGFCETCYGTVMLIESGGDAKLEKVDVDFDDKNSWHYLFKLYWLALKQKLLLTVEELSKAKSPWKTSGVSACNEESSDELYTGNDEQEESSDSSSVRHEGNISRKRNRRRSSKPSDVVSNKVMSIERKSMSEESAWASPQLLEFTAHMREGDISVLTQFDVQALLLEYIKRNNLRDPRKKSQIICDTMLQNLFHKQRVGHFEMLKLLESHFLIKETSQVRTDENQEIVDPHSGQLDAEEHFNITTNMGCDKKRKLRKKADEREPQNTDDYAAIDTHNINLIYLRRNLLEDLIDDSDAFKEKVVGAFVRIRIPGAGQKQDMYRLVKIIGTHVVAEKYKVGKKTTNVALDILNLDKTEKILMDTVSNQDFTEEECRRLRQSIKCGLINRLTVGDVLEKAKTFQAVRVNDWLESEKLRLSHLRDRASETGRRKELRECVEKLQLLGTPEERMRRLNDLPEIHVDTHMDPNYESPEELDVKKGDNYKRLRGSLSSKKANDLVTRGSISGYSWKDGDKSTDTSWLSNKSLPIEGFQDKFVIGDKPNGLMENRGSSMGTMQTLSSNSKVIFWNDSQLGKPEVSSGGLSGSLASCVSSESMLSQVQSKTNENDKVWNYLDPSGRIQGPFSVIQLRKWNTTGYFPPDMRVWLTSQKQEDSILLTDALMKTEKDVQQEGFQQSNCTKLENFTGRMDISENHYDSLKGKNNFTSVEIRQDGRQWSESQVSSTPPTMANDVAIVDRWAPPSVTCVASHGELPNTRSGSAGMAPRGWESSNDIKSLYAQPQGSGTPNSISAPHSGSSYHLPAYQDRGSQEGIAERWSKNSDHQGLWNSNASRDIRPNGHDSGKQNFIQNYSSEQQYQRSNEEHRKTYSENDTRNKWSSESCGLPIPNKLQSTNWSSDQGFNNPSSASTTAFQSRSNWHSSQNLSIPCTKKSQFFESACPSPTPQSPVQTNESVDSKRVTEACKASASEGWSASFASAPLPTDCVVNERQHSDLPCETKKIHAIMENRDEKTFSISPSINSTTGCSDKSVSDERLKDSSVLKPVLESQELLIDPVYGQNQDVHKSGHLTSGNMMKPNLLETQESDFPVPMHTELINLDDMESVEWSFPSPTPAPRVSEWDTPSPTPENSRIKATVSCDALRASTSPRIDASRLADFGAFEHVTTNALTRNRDPEKVENLEWGQSIQDEVSTNWGSLAKESGEVAWETSAFRDKSLKTGWEMAGHGNMNANSSTGTLAPGTNINPGWEAQPRGNMNNYGGWATSIPGQDIVTSWGFAGDSTSWGTPIQENVRTRTSWGTGEVECATENISWNMLGKQGNINGSSNDIWGTSLENANWNSHPRNFDSPGTRRYDRDRYQDGNDRDLRHRNHRNVGRGSSQQGQRGVCKFYESGNCSRGSSCKYLHP